MRSALILASLSLLIAFSGCKKDLLTADGTQYVIHTKSGNPKPNPGDWIYFHAYIRNGEEVINTSRKGEQVPYAQLPGNVDAEKGQSILQVLQHLGIGDSATILVRLDTINPKPPGFETADMLYYDVVIQDIKPDAKFQEDMRAEQQKQMAEMQLAQARFPAIDSLTKDVAARIKSGALASELKQTNSGLKYIIHEEGTGPMAEPGKNVTVHYHGVLTDGKMFDSSFQSGEAIRFSLGVGQVIPGWDEGLALLKEGTKATLYVPYPLAYGEAGDPPTIPAKSDLIFYVELIKAN